jgi:benzoate membrane transport protein
MREPPPSRLATPHAPPAFRGAYFVNAAVAFLFAITGPVAIVLTIGQQGKLTETDIASWLFGAFFINGVVSLILCLRYRQPLVCLWTIPGAVLVGQALDHFSFAQVIGTYYATGLLMLVLGLSGWIGKLMSRIPMPIIMAMVAGVFLQFGLSLIFAIRDGAAIAAPMTIAFVLLSALPKLARVLPPTIGALAVGVAAIVLTGAFELHGPMVLAVIAPRLYVPEFSWPAMVELVLPLAITVLAAQNAQGFAVLEAAGHRPPVNVITATCGLASLVTAPFGTVSTCFTGPANAILVSGGEPAKHYFAGINMALLALLFGLFSPTFTQLMLALPSAFIVALAGLALLKVLERSFVVSFNGRFTFGALVSFLVTAANVPIWSIGAPFWAVLAGFGASWLLEPQDFATLGAARDVAPADNDNPAA